MPSGPGAYPWTQLEPSGVGELLTSCSPTSVNASTTHAAAFSHSSGGYCFGSATDWKDTSSARSSLARPISPLTASRSSSACTAAPFSIALHGAQATAAGFSEPTDAIGIVCVVEAAAAARSTVAARRSRR